VTSFGLFWSSMAAPVKLLWKCESCMTFWRAKLRSVESNPSLLE
jgi:hypothetical protein